MRRNVRVGKPFRGNEEVEGIAGDAVHTLAIDNPALVVPMWKTSWYRKLFIGLVLFLVAGVFRYLQLSKRGEWCSRTEEQIFRQCSLLTKVVAILRAHKFKHWLCYGSALAAFRDTKPIPWEIDDDLCILQKDLGMIHTILEENAADLGVNVIYADEFSVVALQIRPEVPRSGISSAGEYTIDFYAHKERSFYNGSIHMMQNVALVRDRFKRDIPMNLLEPLRPLQYCSASTHKPLFFGPANISTYLSHLYGTSFLTPQTVVQSNGPRGWRCILSKK
jgi:hypothetical protein